MTAENRFDQLTRELGTTASRRKAIRIMAGAVATGGLSLIGLRPAGADDPGRCRKIGVPCRRNTECCSGFCDPATARCACPPRTNLCPKTGLCISQCSGGTVFNPETCECDCPPGTVVCVNSMGFRFCCPAGSTCCDFVCCPSGTACCGTISMCCPTGTTCCGFQCCPSGSTCCGSQCCPPGFQCCPGPFGSFCGFC